MIHPINIEADVMSIHPQRPKLFLPPQRSRITYSTDGRKLVNGQLKSPLSPNNLWNLCFLRSFARRLSSVAKEEIQDTASVDSFIDVVDLKPNDIRPITNNSGSGSEDEDILPATFIQGPKSASQRGSIKRNVSKKVGRNLIVPLISSCCNDIQQNFKEFLRFDFSNTVIPKDADSETVMTPDPQGKRIWTRDTEKPRSPLTKALCFQIASVVSRVDKIAIKINASNPSEKQVHLEVVIHVHAALDSEIGQRIYCSETKIVELPRESPIGTPIEFEIPLNEQMHQINPNEYLLVTMLGHVLPDH